ncbi:cell wall hydrolase [Jiella mangrovi]|nr:cell wall hydrolase [Jiella mangrovi]
MNTTYPVTSGRFGLVIALLLPLAGCVGAPGADEAFQAVATKDFGPAQECLARAMYFESNRSSEDGMLAVGTVVMNRVDSPAYPNDVCAVVGQPNQFAPGVMTRRMEAGKELAMKVAYRVLSGERHKAVAHAKFFHTAGMHFPYRNMSYRLIAGGNAFYEKISRRLNPDAKIVSQSEIRQAQNAAGAIDLMRTASTAPPKPGNATSAIGYSEPRAQTASAVPTPIERPAEGEATATRQKSPFLAMFETRKPARAEDAVRGGRVAETAAVSDGRAASTSDLPGVETAAASSEAKTRSESSKNSGEAWLARW